jgi:hypothetical protein
LAAESAAVVLGSIEKREVGMSNTIAQIRIERVFKGPVKDGSIIRLLIQSGRVMISETEPDLTGVARGVFFIKSNENSVKSDEYVCVRGSYGLKTLIHDSVYTNPQSPLDTVKFKKYQEALSQIK